ncbi:hypothetical protein [Methylobacterium sp. A54F]
MRRALLATTLSLPFLLVATAAMAQRPSTTAMSCGQARSAVMRAGAVVLGTGGQTYDRFVRDRNFCEATEIARTAFAPTRDNLRCFVGYTCYEPSRNDWFGDY